MMVGELGSYNHPQKIFVFLVGDFVADSAQGSHHHFSPQFGDYFAFCKHQRSKSKKTNQKALPSLKLKEIRGNQGTVNQAHGPFLNEKKETLIGFLRGGW